MATYSKNLSGDSRYSVRIDVTEKSYNVANNTSIVDWKAYLVKTSGLGFYTYDAKSPYEVKIAGVVVASGNMAYDFRGSTPKTIVIGSGSRTITHNANGSGSVAASAYFRDNNNSLGSGTASGTLTLTTLNRVGYIGSHSSSFIINDGLSVTPTSRSNGLTYQVGIYDANGSTSFASYRAVTANTSNKINLTASEQNAIYNYLSSASGSSVRLYMRTMSGSTVLGLDYKIITARPRALTYTAPTSFNLGTAFSVGVSPNASVLYHGYGLVINGSWLTGYPQTIAAGGTSGTITTATYNQKKAIMAINKAATSHGLQVYMRQYNARGVELGLVIKNITSYTPTVSVVGSLGTAGAGILRAQLSASTSGSITGISNLAYSLNGGAFIQLSTGPANPHIHTITGLLADTTYTIQYRVRQFESDVNYYSSALTIKTLAESTLTISPTTLYVDDNLAVTTTKASAVTNRLTMRRLTDNVAIYSNNNQAAGTMNRTFTDADFNDGAAFEGHESITVRLTLEMMTNGEVEKSITRDVIVLPNGVVYIREAGAWKRAYVESKSDNTFKRAIPYVRVANEWQKAKS